MFIFQGREIEDIRQVHFPLNKLNLWKYIWFIVKKITSFFNFQREEVWKFAFYFYQNCTRVFIKTIHDSIKKEIDLYAAIEA